MWVCEAAMGKMYGVMPRAKVHFQKEYGYHVINALRAPKPDVSYLQLLVETDKDLFVKEGLPRKFTNLVLASCLLMREKDSDLPYCDLSPLYPLVDQEPLLPLLERVLREPLRQWVPGLQAITWMWRRSRLPPPLSF